MPEQIPCPACHSPLKFRAWSKRYPPKSEALADCVVCRGKWQVRYWNGKRTSEPYQVRIGTKTATVSGRVTPQRKAAIIAIYGTVQNFIEHSSLIRITNQ